MFRHFIANVGERMFLMCVGSPPMSSFMAPMSFITSRLSTSASLQASADMMIEWRSSNNNMSKMTPAAAAPSDPNTEICSSSETASKKIDHGPLSRAVGLLLTKERFKRDQIVSALSDISNDLIAAMRSLEPPGPAEVGTFCEIAKKLDFCTQSLADAVIDYLSAGHVKDLTAEELPGILWVVGERDDVDVSLSVELGQAVHRLLPDLRHEDLPSVITIIVSIGPADPLLLTALTDTVIDQLDAFTPLELKALVTGYGSQWALRSFFDDNLFKGLAAAIMKRIGEFTPIDLREIITVYRSVCSRHANLGPVLKNLEAEISPLMSPTPQ